MMQQQRHNCCKNIKVLCFFYPDDQKTFHVYQGNMEYRRGKGNGWFVLAICSEDAGGAKENMEAFPLEVACELIGTTEQTKCVKVVNLLVPTEEEEEGEDQENQQEQEEKQHIEKNLETD